MIKDLIEYHYNFSVAWRHSWRYSTKTHSGEYSGQEKTKLCLTKRVWEKPERHMAATFTFCLTSKLWAEAESSIDFQVEV